MPSAVDDPVVPRLLRAEVRWPEVRTRGAPPPVPALAIRRPRLEELVDAHPDRRVVLVRGPAGAGKTVLVAQWLAARSAPCCWLTVDAGDDDPHVLLRRLTEAAEQLTADPSRAHGPDGAHGSNGSNGTNGSNGSNGSNGLHASNGSEPAAAPGDVDLDDGVLRDVLEAAGRHHGGPVHLVLDGADRLCDPRSLGVVARLVEHPPEGVRLVLLGRSKPRLGIERARLRDDLVEVGPSALRFVRAEIEALAATWTGRHVDAQALEQATLGWAAGLRLAQLDAAVDDAAVAGLRDPDGFAGEYIREELIDGSAADLQAFLEVTCWLPLVTGPLVAAVAGRKARRTPLTLAETQALPLVPVASRPGAFRYPPVLVQALQREYRRRDPRAVRRALCRAAEAGRRCGELVTAIELYLEAERTSEAAEACTDLAAGGDGGLLRIDELFRRRPDLVPEGPRWLAWSVRAAVAAGRVDEAAASLRRLGVVVADDNPETGDAPDDQGCVQARAAVAEHLGDVNGMLACAERMMLAVRRTTRWTVAELTARCWRIRAWAWSGQLDHARRELERLEAAANARPEAVVPLALARAWLAWLDGDVTRVSELVALAEEQGTGNHLAELALLAGSAHREANRLAPAVVRLQEAAGHAHNVVASLAASELARCHRAAGATMEALELVVSTRSSCPGLPPAVEIHLRTTEALVRLDGGDVIGAHTVARAAPPGADAQLLAARVALRQAPSRAAALLEPIVTRTTRQAVEKMLLRAQLPGAEPAEVSVSLMKAVRAGEPLGLVRTFLDEGPATCRLFPELAVEASDRALGRIAALACQELAQAPTPTPVAPIEQLTARELAVLRMLPLRLSNREMAAQMYISVNTLKTHVRAIYRKLDVPHRSAAVRRAKALELV
jgi:LuxR family maltose regulon positive regulatory protein